jgi:hypothetical protein
MLKIGLWYISPKCVDYFECWAKASEMTIEQHRNCKALYSGSEKQLQDYQEK